MDVTSRLFGNRRKRFFLKKEAKNFYLPWALSMMLPDAARNQSFFASFCSQKEVLPSLFVS
jgi:hypothetical protein